jgi:Mn2+/Fe2+ NRAMP family transporter
VALEIEKFLNCEIYEPAIRLQCLDAELTAHTGEARSQNLSEATIIKIRWLQQFNIEVDR